MYKHTLDRLLASWVPGWPCGQCHHEFLMTARRPGTYRRPAAFMDSACVSASQRTRPAVWSLSREPGGEAVAEELEASLEGGPVWPAAELWPHEREHHVRDLVVELGRLRGGEPGRPERSRECRPERKGVRAGERP